MKTGTGLVAESPGRVLALADFWSLAETERDEVLEQGVIAAHAYHFERNTAYRNTVAAHGVGPCVCAEEFPRILRATSQAFKSYTDLVGTPFPQDRPAGFVDWLSEQVSVELDPGRHHFRRRYLSLEGLLRAIERAYSGLGLRMLTSSGTSGRASVVPRDTTSSGLTAQSLHLSFQRYLGVEADCTAIFTTPKRTRVALARLARSGLQSVGLDPDRVHFTFPLPAYPDQVRVRAGRTYRGGPRGLIERQVSHPLTTLVHKRLLDARAVETAISQLIPASAHREKVLLFGGLAQLHGIATFLLDGGRTMTLAPGSLLATAGGMKEAYAWGPEEIREDLQRAFKLPDGEPVPVRDIYGMAEADWAAMQCSHHNYHIPPWVYAVTLDENGAFQRAPRTTGMLAFFDPFGGDLFPAFFRTADQVTLVRGGSCPCGEPGSYLEEASIRPTDLPEEAGCRALT
jgi:Acyl-protein synthetase, LuxE